MRKIILSFIIAVLLVSSINICTVGETFDDSKKQGSYLSDDGTEYWGVLISNYEQQYNNLSLGLRDILCENGWQQDHIKYFNCTTATYANVVNALNWLAKNSDSNDKILFYDASHGNIGYFGLSDHKMMSYSELDQFFDNITYNGLAVILGACYSGSAIPILEKEKRVIITACDANHEGSGPFHNFCFNAFEGFADFEGNRDNKVSAEEIYNFVKNDTIRINGNDNLPQISDNYDGELYLTRFNYLNWPGLLDQYAVHNYIGEKPIWDWGWFAQSFVPTYPVLTAVMLNIKVIGNPGLLTVSIKEDLYGEDICSVTVDQNSFYHDVQGFWIINLPNVTVTPGLKYWIVMRTYKPWNQVDMYVLLQGTISSYTKGESASSFDQGTNWYIYEENGYGDLYFATLGRPINNPPYAPNISGPTNGEAGVSYNYVIYTTDADGDNVSYYIDWEDNTTSGWIGPYISDENITVNHTWANQGTYTIRAKAKDIHGDESGWATHQSHLQSNSSLNTGTPGFELIFVVCAIALVLLWKRKRENE